MMLGTSEGTAQRRQGSSLKPHAQRIVATKDGHQILKYYILSFSGYAEDLRYELCSRVKCTGNTPMSRPFGSGLHF